MIEQHNSESDATPQQQQLGRVAAAWGMLLLALACTEELYSPTRCAAPLQTALLAPPTGVPRRFHTLPACLHTLPSLNAQYVATCAWALATQV